MSSEKVKEIIEKLKELQKSDDYECAHIDADQILCECLDELGYKEITREFVKVGRWYA